MDHQAESYTWACFSLESTFALNFSVNVMTPFALCDTHLILNPRHICNHILHNTQKINFIFTPYFASSPVKRQLKIRGPSRRYVTKPLPLCRLFTRCHSNGVTITSLILEKLSFTITDIRVTFLGYLTNRTIPLHYRWHPYTDWTTDHKRIPACQCSFVEKPHAALLQGPTRITSLST
jgi:hypothetical protein